ncbi:MAG TPA: hypothetical protein K8V56_13275 [Sporosarcina psychrophila]|uniref:DUF3951 domain-containing protein n=1 Tax=Sporosarcina psychrophila TaxID=1476 RepID=A0A921KF19_SPOPS|nr:hypothetical protein [Sporosarcina psychrophila]
MTVIIIAVVAIALGLGGMLLIGFAIYKTVFNKKHFDKKEPGNMFTPYDDMTRGTNDTNRSKYLDEDTRHRIGIEETKNNE